MPSGIFTNPKLRAERISESKKGKSWGHHTEETKKHLSEVKKKMGSGKWMKGRKLSEETRNKISLGNKGKKVFISDETRRKMSEMRKGKPSGVLGKHWKMSEQGRINISKAHKREKAYQWKGGITPENKIIRGSIEIRLWRESVFERDSYTYVWCGKQGCKLNADHIKPFADYPELRFAIDNGRTLCEDCHRKTETFGFNRLLNAENIKKQNKTITN